MAEARCSGRARKAPKKYSPSPPSRPLTRKSGKSIVVGRSTVVAGETTKGSDSTSEKEGPTSKTKSKRKPKSAGQSKNKESSSPKKTANQEFALHEETEAGSKRQTSSEGADTQDQYQHHGLHEHAAHPAITAAVLPGDSNVSEQHDSAPRKDGSARKPASKRIRNAIGKGKSPPNPKNKRTGRAPKKKDEGKPPFQTANKDKFLVESTNKGEEGVQDVKKSGGDASGSKGTIESSVQDPSPEGGISQVIDQPSERGPSTDAKVRTSKSKKVIKKAGGKEVDRKPQVNDSAPQYHHSETKPQGDKRKQPSGSAKKEAKTSEGKSNREDQTANIEKKTSVDTEKILPQRGSTQAEAKDKIESKGAKIKRTARNARLRKVKVAQKQPADTHTTASKDTKPRPPDRRGQGRPRKQVADSVLKTQAGTDVQDTPNIKGSGKAGNDSRSKKRRTVKDPTYRQGIDEIGQDEEEENPKQHLKQDWREPTPLDEGRAGVQPLRSRRHSKPRRNVLVGHESNYTNDLLPPWKKGRALTPETTIVYPKGSGKVQKKIYPPKVSPTRKQRTRRGRAALEEGKEDSPEIEGEIVHKNRGRLTPQRKSKKQIEQLILDSSQVSRPLPRMKYGTRTDPTSPCKSPKSPPSPGDSHVRNERNNARLILSPNATAYSPRHTTLQEQNKEDRQRLRLSKRTEQKLKLDRKRRSVSFEDPPEQQSPATSSFRRRSSSTSFPSPTSGSKIRKRDSLKSDTGRLERVQKDDGEGPSAKRRKVSAPAPTLSGKRVVPNPENDRTLKAALEAKDLEDQPEADHADTVQKATRTDLELPARDEASGSSSSAESSPIDQSRSASQLGSFCKNGFQTVRNVMGWTSDRATKKLGGGREEEGES